MEKRKDAFKELLIQSQRNARAFGQRVPLRWSEDKRPQSFYQGPKAWSGGTGTTDAMPGTSGHIFTQPTLLDDILCKLKIGPCGPKRIDLTPTQRPAERYKGVI